LHGLTLVFGNSLNIGTPIVQHVRSSVFEFRTLVEGGRTGGNIGYGAASSQFARSPLDTDIVAPVDVHI
jgi:hypothetical protein